jgi:hypothetical protein
MPEKQPIDLVNVAQAIISAHEKSDQRLEQLIKGIPQSYLSEHHFELRHTELERRVMALETALDKMLATMAELPDQIIERIERHRTTSRAQVITVFIAIIGWLIAVIGLILSFLRI